MEEKITRTVKEIMLGNLSNKDGNNLNDFIDAVANKDPVMILPHFYQIDVGDRINIQGYPACAIVPLGWSNPNGEITYTETQTLIRQFRIRLDVFAAADDSEYLEYMAMRYRCAIDLYFDSNYDLGGLVLGSILSNADVGNSEGGDSELELGNRLYLDVLAQHRTNEIVHI